MYQALYRKYRPRFFRDVAGQEHITSVLSKEVSEKTFGHAYLFTGSRGIGKTTCAKILAKAVNCPYEKDGEPCGECEICRGIDDGSLLDITEMDAASNRNIDDIRDLRSEANFTPAVAKYRVYIIDEAHMLTKEAANALLKIMEEPPEHVIFILATTEVHRLPATILSRCMRFDYRRMPPEVIAERVKFVCKMERIDIDDEGAMLIGKLADGGMRDALSLLDICRSSDETVTAETVSRCAGLAGREYLFELTDKIALNDISAVLETVDKLYEGSADVSRICDELINHFRNLMIVSCTKDASAILKLMPGELLRTEKQAKEFSQAEIFHAVSVLQDTLVKMSKSASKRLEFELALVKLCSPALTQSQEALLARIEKAYSDIAGTNDITTFNNDIKKLAEDKGIKGTDLAVSDLFDLRVVDCTVHEDHTSYTIELDSENLDRFVALIHANEKGEWEIVADAKVTENGKRLKFSVESFSPFAIVVNRNETVEPGDNTMIIIWVMVAAASGLLLVALLAKKNKKQHEL